MSYYHDLTLLQAFQLMTAQLALMLRPNWLKFLRQRHVAVLRQGPGTTRVYDGIISKLIRSPGTITNTKRYPNLKLLEQIVLQINGDIQRKYEWTYLFQKFGIWIND